MKETSPFDKAQSEKAAATAVAVGLALGVGWNALDQALGHGKTTQHPSPLEQQTQHQHGGDAAEFTGSNGQKIKLPTAEQRLQ